MKTLVFLPLSLLLVGCTRAGSRSHVATPTDAGVVVASTIDADVVAAPEAKAAPTLAGYCKDFITKNDSPDGFMCRGQRVHPTCAITEKTTLATLGTVALVDEKGPTDTKSTLMIVDRNGHFALAEQVTTEECDLGDPADVSLQLVAAHESADGGTPQATIAVDSIRNDPPYQGGGRIWSVARHSVRCQEGADGLACDKPTTLGTFNGPVLGDRPPPFSQWTRKN